MTKEVHYGQSLVSVLTTLGNPNKEFYKDEYLYLNYFELGLDIQFEHRDCTVNKIIVNLNFPEMTNFCFYDR